MEGLLLLLLLLMVMMMMLLLLLLLLLKGAQGYVEFSDAKGVEGVGVDVCVDRV